MNIEEKEIYKKSTETLIDSLNRHHHERSKREDSNKLVYREPNPKTMGPMMKAKYEKAKEITRCGALNIVETQ